MTATSRRTFLQATAATAALGLINNAYAAGNDTIKVGVIGCGGRGRGAMGDCVSAAPGVQITALCDVFQEPVNTALKVGAKFGKEKFDVPAERAFVGLDGYKKVIDSGVDLVILATPPGFRPQHLEAAINADKHVFTEKPVAVDGPGIRKCLELAELAKKKNRAVVAGTQRRHQKAYLDMVARLQNGEIGDILSASCYWNMGDIWFRPRKPGMTDLAYQLHNWYHFNWVCGDHIVEQHVHNLDVVNWVLKAHPIKCLGMGGRSNRAVGAPGEVGNIFDHFAVEYEYENGLRMFSFCRQIRGCTQDVSEVFVGTKGRCRLADKQEYSINGKEAFSVEKDKEVKPYIQEHTDLITSIRAGKPLNDLQTVTESTLTAIMGRMAAYTGKPVTWKQALESKEVLMPANLDWNMSLQTPPVPVPGQTKLI